MLPQLLKNFSTYANGDSFLGIVEQVKLPDINRKMEAIRLGGLQSEIEADMGLELMECVITSHEVNRHIISHIGEPSLDGTRITFRGFEQAGDGSPGRPIEAEIGCRQKSLGGRTAKAGDLSPVEASYSVVYYRYVIDGQEALLIDVLNHKFVVDGVDRLEAERNALGI